MGVVVVTLSVKEAIEKITNEQETIDVLKTH
jgi:hypothetical protein